MTLYDQLANDDGDTIRQLRELQRRRAEGIIGQAAFDAAFRALDRSVGRPCDNCGHVPAVIIRAGRVLCGRCAAGRPRRLSWRRLAVAAIVIIVPLLLALAYAAAAH